MAQNEKGQGLDDQAFDHISIVIRECNLLSATMSKQLGRVNILHSSSHFSKNLKRNNNQNKSNSKTHFTNGYKSIANDTHGDNEPLVYGFIELKSILMSIKDIKEIDSLTILQPFLLVISTSSTSGYITNLALVSIYKFLFQHKIINENSLNHILAIRQAMVSLTHCRFEGTEQMFDDAVLLRVLELIQKIFVSQHGDILTDSQVYDVLQTVLSLACNKKRTEVLRKAAESTLTDIVTKLMYKLKGIEETFDESHLNNNTIVNEKVFVDKEKQPLIDDLIGSSTKYSSVPAENDINSIHSRELMQGSSDEQSIEANGVEESQNPNENEFDETDEENYYGLPVIRDFLSVLVSLLSPEQSLKHNYSTKTLSFQLLNIIMEISGRDFFKHPSLLSLLSDPVSKNLAFIFKNIRYTKADLLQVALQLFVTICLTVADELELQIEFMFKLLLDFIVDGDTSNGTGSNKSNNSNANALVASMKEIIIEHISVLWTRSQSNADIFTNMFIKYDCSLDKSDLAIFMIEKMCVLSLPEMAEFTSDSVPPICLNGIISFIEDIYQNFVDVGGFKDEYKTEEHETLKTRFKKTQFIEATSTFNIKPKKGIPKFIEYNFISDNSESSIGKFLFKNSNALNKKTIGEFIGSKENVNILEQFISFFDFKELRVDEAIRIMLTKFRLPGESQQIERVVEAFCQKYVKDQNYELKGELFIDTKDIEEGDYSSIRPDPDSVLVLSYSIIMLNTDLHNPQIKKHMTFTDYSLNLKGCNNEKDFPLWYLQKMYDSIKNKEIVMPEEHHGNELWFDDQWNTLITSVTLTSKKQQRYSDVEVLQFNKFLFKETSSKILKVLFEIFQIATDDYISSTVVSTLDKCSILAEGFGFKELYNSMMYQLALSTRLTNFDTTEEIKPLIDFLNVKPLIGSLSEYESEYEDIPFCEIVNTEVNSSLTVSKKAVLLGKTLKAQLSTILLFRMVRLNRTEFFIDKEVWRCILQILYVLYDNKLIIPDIFRSFQKKNKLPKLPKPVPANTISKENTKSGNKNRNGFFNTFASYLKGDDYEPTSEEIEFSEIAHNCIVAVEVSEIFEENAKNYKDMILLELLFETIKSLDIDSKNESFKLFLIEFLVGAVMVSENIETQFINKCYQLIEIDNLSQNSKAFALRVLIYKLNLMSLDFTNIQKIIDELLKSNKVYDDEFYGVKSIGTEVLKKLLHIVESNTENQVHILNYENFWRLLRKFSSFEKNCSKIYTFLDNLNNDKRFIGIDCNNFMLLLGLLDEISSKGAIGLNITKDEDEAVVAVSQNTIILTQKLVAYIDFSSNEKERYSESSDQLFALIQAMAHQCMNPFKPIRELSQNGLNDLLNGELIVSQNLPLVNLVNSAIEPLLDSLEEQDEKLHVLRILKDFYLKKHKLNNTEDEENYPVVLNIFNKYNTTNDDVEKVLQELITEKNAFVA
ncbi:hypothetical protein QEN19_003379 [Hanseniaspora menglaensis]